MNHRCDKHPERVVEILVGTKGIFHVLRDEILAAGRGEWKRSVYDVIPWIPVRETGEGRGVNEILCRPREGSKASSPACTVAAAYEVDSVRR